MSFREPGGSDQETLKLCINGGGVHSHGGTKGKIMENPLKMDDSGDTPISGTKYSASQIHANLVLATVALSGILV